MASKMWRWIVSLDAYLARKYPDEVPRRVLEEFIWQEFGADERTVVKYLKTLERVGVVKMVNMNVYKYQGLKLETKTE